MATTKVNTNQVTDTLFNSLVARQALINPNCQVNQGVTAVNLTSGKLFGSVDMFYAKGAGTAVSAGTITQTTTASCGNSGYALKLAGVTLTGTGLVYAYTFIESINAKLYKNKTASFSVKVYHDVGSAINYTIKINKANSADNFSAITEIAAGSATSVSNTTETLIKLENVSLGDCSNGIEIEVSAACGAVTTKNFEFTEWQFNLGSTVLDFCCNNFNDEKLNCQRYYVKSYPDGVAPGSLTVAGGIATAYFNSVTTTGEIGQVIVLPTTPRILNNTIITIYSPSNGSAGYLDRYLLGIGGTPSTVNVSSSWTNNRSFFVYSSGSADANHLRFHYVVDARPTIA